MATGVLPGHGADAYHIVSVGVQSQTEISTFPAEECGSLKPSSSSLGGAVSGVEENMGAEELGRAECGGDSQ